MQFKSAFLAAGLSALVSAQNTPNLTALLGSSSSLSGLVTLLGSYPSIASNLANLTNVTIFAPNNGALQRLQVSGALNNATESQIAQILNYHVVPEVVYSSALAVTPVFAPTLLNSTMYTNVTGGQVVEAGLIGNNAVLTSGLKLESTVVDADLNFTGGVVHVIDNVLTIPPGLTQTAEAANLTALAGALIATNLLTTLQDASDLTIFAPTNAAFAAIASAAGNLTTQEATSLLEYHVINGTVAYSSSLGNGSVTTAAGSKLNITVEDGAVFVNSARVILADVLYAGGVIHVIDSVLNPANRTSPDASNTSPVVQFSGASSGTAVPFTSQVPAFTASTTYSGLTQTTADVASGYTTRQGGGAVATTAPGAGSGSGSSSSSGVAAMPTGAIGAAALFGGAALVANW